MAEDRPIESVEEALARNERERKDFESTVLARLSRRPAGTIEWTLSTTARQYTVFLHGQTLPRATHPDLWRWIQDTSPAGFGVGDGSTTFTVPDTRGRVLRCTPAAGETVGQQVGADTRTLTTANLPAHDHNVGISSAGTHDHTGSMDSAGSHSGHNSGAVTGIDNPGGGLSIASFTQNSGGSHAHGFSINNAGSHTHPVTESSVGSGTGFDNRPAALNGHLLVWF